MNLVILVSIFFGIMGLVVVFYSWYFRRPEVKEKRLMRFLKRNDGEVDSRLAMKRLRVSRGWLEEVSGRLVKKGRIVKWGWRKKSLICLKGSGC